VGATIPISPSTLNELLNYNYWARDRQLQACAALTEEQLLRPLGGSFASLRDTLVHLIAVEWIWLERWRGNSPRALPGPGEFPTLAAVRARWRGIESEMRAFVATLDEAALERRITCVGTRGNSWTYELWRMILHLLNHQSYHRGQVTAQLRQLGAQPPKVDFLDAQDAEFQ